MNDHIKRHNDNILTRMRGMEAQPVSGMIDPKNPTNGPGSAPTHTPAAQPAGEMDDAALVEAMAWEIFKSSFAASDQTDWQLLKAKWVEWEGDQRAARRQARSALAIARPVLQDQARRKALDEAAKEAICHSRYEDPYDTAHRIADAILALKDKPNG